MDGEGLSGCSAALPDPGGGRMDERAFVAGLDRLGLSACLVDADSLEIVWGSERAAKLLGSLRGRLAPDLFVPAERGAVRALHEAVRQQGAPCHGEYRALSPEGRILWVRVE